MKGILFIAACLTLAGCDSRTPTAAPLQDDGEKLELQRAALAAEQQRLAEAELAQLKAAADAEAKRLSIERAELQSERERLAEEQAKLQAAQAANVPAAPDAPPLELAPSTIAPPPLEVAAARATEEQTRLDALKAQAEADRLAAERNAAEAKAREIAARRAAEEAAIERTTAVFFDALSGHGDWFETDRHGFAWRPKRAAIDREWRPYTDGRWQWTEYGWTWQSLEPYGWAVYHYGRWIRHDRAGWLWVPGHEWAPAWVAWRVKGSQFAGWAPLPPEKQASTRGYGVTVDRELEIAPGSYVFLPVVDFDEPTYVHKFVERHRQMEMLRGSRNLTRIEIRGSTFVAGGPDPGMISSVIRQHREDPDARPLPQLNLVFGGKPGADHAADTVEAGAMLLFAPKLEKARSGGKPKLVRETLRVPDRDHGWLDSSPEQETEWRSMTEREALHAAAAARAAEQAARQPMAARAQTAAPVTQAAAPQRVNVNAAPRAPRPNPLNPAGLQPASGLFNRR